MREPCSRHPNRAAVYCAECCEELRTENERLRQALRNLVEKMTCRVSERLLTEARKALAGEENE